MARWTILRVFTPCHEGARTPSGAGQHFAAFDVTTDDRAVHLRVTDDGPGVPEDQIAKLTAPFFRADEARSQANGAGLGLAIAQAIADGHGGRLELSNRNPRGFSAKLVLPG